MSYIFFMSVPFALLFIMYTKDLFTSIQSIDFDSCWMQSMYKIKIVSLPLIQPLKSNFCIWHYFRQQSKKLLMNEQMIVLCNQSFECLIGSSNHKQMESLIKKPKSKAILAVLRMKAQMDDSNYEGMIGKLAKGSLEEKAVNLKKLLFLYENARSRIYLYQRRITECLELSLLIEEKDISLSALTLLEKIIVNASPQSDLASIIRRRLLSKVVLNLGSVEVTVRKVSHKCILEYVRKFRDLETVMSIYLKTAMQQNQNFHLKLKAINSFHSLLMSETKSFSHDLQSSRSLLEELIHSSYQKEYVQIRRAALISLIFIMRVQGIEKSLANITPEAANELNQLRYESDELSFLLDALQTHEKGMEGLTNNQNEHENNTPSPKFISIQETSQMKMIKHQSPIDLVIQKMQKIPQIQLKIFNQVSYAQDFLKRLQKAQGWQFNQIQEFAPFLEKCLVDESIKLFSISKKIVQVIFNSQDGKKKQYYVVLVPCIVNGIGNKRFIVRKNLDKLARQYLKNHTEVWVKNFIQRFSMTKNCKVKQILIDLLSHAYKSSPEFYYPIDRTFEVFDCEMNDSTSTIKRKVIDCILLIIERQGKDEKTREQMLQIFSTDPYNKIVRKMGKANNSLGSLSDEGDPQTLQPLSPIIVKKERKQRLVTAQPEKVAFLEKSQEKQRNQNVSEEKYKPKQLVQYSRERRVRNSQIQINFRVKKPQRRSKDEKNSLQRLPQLKKAKNSSTSKYQANDSPVKRSIGQRNIIYIQRQNLKPLQNPRVQLQKSLTEIKDPNWTIQFDSINKIRSITQFNSDLINDDILGFIVNEMISCIGNLRSGVTKLALMCLNQTMRKFHRKMYPFSENIILTIIKKSITTSQFMQDEIKKCISTSVEQLCLPKIIQGLNAVKDTKSNDVKITFLLFVQGMIKNDKIYKKQFEWIWTILTDFNEQPQFNLRSQCKRLVKLILESYKDWKNDVVELKKDLLQKIDKLLKNLNQKGENNLWIQIQNHQFQKIILSKIMTSKYFANNYSKFQEMDKNYTIKKNWKDRIKLLNDIFQLAFEYPQQFQSNLNIKKYFNVAIDQIDDKNPGLFINSLNNLQKSIDVFPNAIEECISSILQKTLTVFQSRRGELISVASKMLNKIYNRYDANKIMKEYLKILVGNSKNKGEVINQLIILLKESEGIQNEGRSIREIPFDRNSNLQNSQILLNGNTQGILIKSLVKICSQKSSQILPNWNNRLKQLITLCQRRFGPQFSNKLLANSKITEIMS